MRHLGNGEFDLTEHDPLGMTVYRTGYDFPNSDELWKNFLIRLESAVKQQIRNIFKEYQNPKDTEIIGKILSLVHFDGRDDITTLKNTTDDELRAIFNDQIGGTPLLFYNTSLPYFLLVDNEVLAAAASGLFWFKIVARHFDI